MAIGLMAVALGLNLTSFHGTLSFLTSEKKQAYSVSTGTNEDVFVTETEQLVLKTQVTKRVKVKRTQNADGSSSETTESKISVHEGVQRILFAAQRAHLELDVENIRVTGLAEDEVLIEKVEQTEGEEEGIVFRIAHNRNMADTANKTEKGELHITALGGFYSLTIPLTVQTSYSSSTEVSEEAAPSSPSSPSSPSPQQPGTSEPPVSSEPELTPEAPTPTTEPGTPADSAEESSGSVSIPVEENETDSAGTEPTEAESTPSTGSAQESGAEPSASDGGSETG